MAAVMVAFHEIKAGTARPIKTMRHPPYLHRNIFLTLGLKVI